MNKRKINTTGILNIPFHASHTHTHLSNKICIFLKHTLPYIISEPIDKVLLPLHKSVCFLCHHRLSEIQSMKLRSFWTAKHPYQILKYWSIG